ncbi:hypothetical protein [Candidatus Bodocaedibacter vickermanii]|uniref:Antitoxin with SUKH family nuclease toxin immunity domain n=1 Tax=Candidatus Bodocaedibacter vickermanii TaxID=2741701 RepID=A0A7L9RTH3_9PROT|nr:Putative antitoxin with SUKH family nuclease toxin immunity domain [Candidatus Paracaedibacteraceae bacterium 'Lake Konstanz']
MILNLEDLFQFMKKHAKEEPLIAEDIMISAPGISTDETNRMIEAFPTLPNSYLSFITKYDVKQIDLAGYEISVCNQKSNNFAREMIFWNGATERRYPISKRHDLVYFGSDGFDEFFVAGTKSDYKEGEILSIDHECYEDKSIPIKRVAPDYETFLIICANKYQLQMNGEQGLETFMKELRLRLDALNLPKEYYDYWVW